MRDAATRTARFPSNFPSLLWMDGSFQIVQKDCQIDLMDMYTKKWIYIARST